MKKFITAILIICTVIFTFYFSLGFVITHGWKKFGPFHHPAVVTHEEDICELNGKKYCVVSLNDFYELKDGTFQTIDKSKEEMFKNIPNNTRLKNYVVRKMAVCNDSFVIEINGDLYAFDSNFQYLYPLNIHIKNGDFIIKDNYIYYTNDEKVRVYSVFSYNFVTKTNTFLKTIEKAEVIQVENNQNIFVNGAGKPSFIDENHNIFKKSVSDEYFQFYDSEEIYQLEIEKSSLIFSSSETSCTFPIESNQKFYKNLKVSNHKVSFATYTFSYEQCFFDANCISNYGKNYVWELDLDTFTLNCVEEFKEGTFLINYLSDSYVYYYDGYIYYNDLAKSVDKIEPVGQFYQAGSADFKSSKMAASITHFAYFQDEIFYRHDTYPENIKINSY